jgi:hypothetical protein
MKRGNQGRRRDPGQRVRAEVHKRYSGIHLYVPLEWLQAAGVASNEVPVYYRLWAAPRGRLIVTLYPEP